MKYIFRYPLQDVLQLSRVRDPYFSKLMPKRSFKVNEVLKRTQHEYKPELGNRVAKLAQKIIAELA